MDLQKLKKLILQMEAIMDRRVDKLIPKAIKAAKTHIADNKKIFKEYNGYISSFGASILQSGLKPAVAFNESASSSSAKNKIPLMQAILELITEQEPEKDAKLLNYILEHPKKESKIKHKIIDAAIALKLAIRTFELK